MYPVIHTDSSIFKRTFLFAFRLKWMEMIFIKHTGRREKNNRVMYLEMLVAWLKESLCYLEWNLPTKARQDCAGED